MTTRPNPSAVCCTAACSVSPSSPSPAPAIPATRFNEIGHQMMCICSCNQILLECNHVGCPDSDGMRNELMAAVSRGDSDSLVEQSFVQKYGPTVLAAPTTAGFDRTAWIVPFVALALGLMLVVLVIRAWKNRPAPAIADGLRTRPRRRTRTIPRPGPQGD